MVDCNAHCAQPWNAFRCSFGCIWNTMVEIENRERVREGMVVELSGAYAHPDALSPLVCVAVSLCACVCLYWYWYLQPQRCNHRYHHDYECGKQLRLQTASMHPQNQHSVPLRINASSALSLAIDVSFEVLLRHSSSDIGSIFAYKQISYSRCTSETIKSISSWTRCFVFIRCDFIFHEFKNYVTDSKSNMHKTTFPSNVFCVRSYMQ